MCVFGSLPIIDMGFSKCDSDFNLTFPFLDFHSVMGFFHLVEMDFQMVFELGEVVSRNSQGLTNPLSSNGGIHGKA